MTKHDTYKLTLDSKYINEYNSLQEAKEARENIGYNYQATIEPIYHGIKSRPKYFKGK